MFAKTFCIGILLLCQVFPARAQDAQQPAAPQQPAAQQPSPPQPTIPKPSTAEPPATQPSPPQTAPAKPAAQLTDEVNSGGGFSIEPYYWLTSTSPILRQGAAFSEAAPGNLDYPGKARRAPGVILSFPAGKGNTLRVSAFRVQGSGSTTSTEELNLFGTDFTSGDLLNTHYTIWSIKASWDYLTYPFQFHNLDFRLKTLWEMQYTNMGSNITSPNDPNASAGSAITAKASRTAVWPTFGLGLENTLSRHIRWEAKASAFAFPHRAVIWDAEGTLAFRVGQFEVLGGEKAYHLKSSPKNAEYVTATLSGAYVGVRWYLQ